MSYHKTRRPILKTYKTRPPKYGPIPTVTTNAARILLPSDTSPHGILDFVLAMQKMNPKGIRDARSGKHAKGSAHRGDTLVARAASIAFNRQ